MKQWLTNSIFILLALICTTTVLAWPWFKYIREIEFVASEIRLSVSGPNGRLADPYHYFITLTLWEVVEVGAMLLGVSCLLAVASSWMFARKGPPQN